MLSRSILILLAVVIIASSCTESKFCGNPTSKRTPVTSSASFELLDSNIVEATNLSLEVARELGESPNFGFSYAAGDTFVIEVKNISSEQKAKEISCLIMNEQEIKQIKTVYLLLEWDKKGNIALMN